MRTHLLLAASLIVGLFQTNFASAQNWRTVDAIGTTRIINGGGIVIQVFDPNGNLVQTHPVVPPYLQSMGNIIFQQPACPVRCAGSSAPTARSLRRYRDSSHSMANGTTWSVASCKPSMRRTTTRLVLQLATAGSMAARRASGGDEVDPQWCCNQSGTVARADFD